MDLTTKPTPTASVGCIRVKNGSSLEINDADLRVGVERADGSNHQVVPSANGEDGGCLRHSVTFQNRNADEVEKFVHVGLQGTTAGYSAPEFATHNGAEFFKNQAIQKESRQDG